MILEPRRLYQCEAKVINEEEEEEEECGATTTTTKATHPNTPSLLPTQSKGSAYLKHGPEVCTESVVDGVPAFVHRQKVADAVTDAVPGDGILDGGQRRQVGPLVFQELDLVLIVAS